MIQVGDLIRDVEDGDCYYEGYVVSLNPLKYKVSRVLWNDEEDDSMNDEVIELKWYVLMVYNSPEWIRINKKECELL